MAIYNSAKKYMVNGTINIETDDVRVALLDSGYAPNIDADTQWSDISINEISGTGYTAGGQQLAGVSLSIDNTDDESVLDANDTVWQTSTITARYAVLYSSSTTSDLLIGYDDFGEDKESYEGDFTVEWNTEGVINLG